MSTAPLRMALVGAGGIGRAYADASATVDEVDLAAVADVDGEAARTLAAPSGAMAVGDPMDLADPTRVDLAVICTPPASHEALAIAFLSAGVPVLCEKPLATSPGAARKIAWASERSGTPFTMASKFRFVSDMTLARSLLEQGELGDVVRVEVGFSGRVDMSDRWNSRPEISGGGVMVDNGTHAVDVIRYLLGPIRSVSATLDTVTPGLGVEDTASAMVRTEGGHLGSADVTWASDWMSPRYVAAFGTRGSLEVGWKGSRLRRLGDTDDVPFGDGYTKLGALGANLRNVARSLLGSEEFRVTPADAVASADVIASAYESARTGAWTDVSPAPGHRMAG